MKIAIIFPRFTGPFGGERLVLKLSESLSTSENEVTIYTRLFDYKLENMNSKDVKIHEISTFNNYGSHQTKNIIDMLLMPLVALRTAREFDVVIGIGWQSAYALLWLIILRKYKRQQTTYYCLEPPRFLYDLRTDSFKKMNRVEQIIAWPIFTLIKYIDHTSVKHIGNLVSISDWTQNQCKNIYRRDSEVIQPGVEIERFQGVSHKKAREDLKLDNDSTIYLTVSKIHPRKMLEKSVDIYLERKDTKSAYFLIGDGPHKLPLQKYINHHSSEKDNIYLLGRLSDEEVTLYMHAANYFIFTAKNEPFGIAPLEAQIAGCEVIPQSPLHAPQNWNQVAQDFLTGLKR